MVGTLVVLGSAAAWAQGAAHFPGEGTFATVLFEDEWPSEGDFDFNDVALRVNTQRFEDVAGQTTHAVYTFNLFAHGASRCSGAALHLPVPAADVVAWRTVGSSDGTSWPAPSSISVEPAGPGASVVSIASDLRALCGGATGFVNTVPGTPTVACQPVGLLIELATPQATLDTAPGDVFVHACDAPGHQVHLSQHYGVVAGSYAVDASRFLQADDASQVDPSTKAPVGTRFYTNAAGVPFALFLGDEVYQIPAERQRIDAATVMPGILDFAAGTGGATFWHAPGPDAFAFTGAPPPLVVADLGAQQPCDAQTATFGFTGATTTYTVPVGCDTLTVHAWGGGGGGGYFGNDGEGSEGAPGGYTVATLAVSPGQAFTVLVGEGGSRNDATSGASPAAFGFGGAPRSGGSVCAVGGGGGLTGLFSGTVDAAGAQVVAGGGGGASGYTQAWSGNHPTASGGNAGFAGTVGTGPWTGGGGGGFTGGGLQTRYTSSTMYPSGDGGDGTVGGAFVTSGVIFGTSAFGRMPPGAWDPLWPGTGTTGRAAVGWGGRAGVYGTHCADAGHGGMVIVAGAEPSTCVPGQRTFTPTDAVETFVVPPGCTTLEVQAWGAGGAGGYNGDGTSVHEGGAGGYSEALLDVAPGETFLVVVGQAGLRNQLSGTGPAAYGFGGAPTSGGNRCAVGGGGGLSGLFHGAVSQAGAEVVAGGGGGSSGYNFGSNGNDPTYAGGNAGMTGTTGSGPWDAGGAGGYFGGHVHSRDGTSAYPAGEGGTGFVGGPHVVSGSMAYAAGGSRVPPMTADAAYPGNGANEGEAIGYGGLGGGYGAYCADAGHGAVVLTWSD